MASLYADSVRSDQNEKCNLQGIESLKSAFQFIFWVLIHYNGPMTKGDKLKHSELPTKEKVEFERKNNRVFKGSPNYVNFLNREVTEFFQKKLINSFKEKPYFHESKINSKGNVIYKKDEEFENGSGTTWTSAEKEVFFDCLARYSIHQIDSICDNLPGKSEIEIMSYYNSLSRELRRLKSKIVRRRKYHKVKIMKDKKQIEYRYKSLPNRKNLVKYENIPIAYEMSENFIKMEEIQAEMIGQRERSKTNDENQRFKRQFLDYTKTKEQSHNTENGEIELEQLQSSDNEVSNEQLINYSIACELSKCLYLNNNITPLTNNKLVPKLHYKSLILLDQITRLVTEKILLKIIEFKVVLTWLNQRKIMSEGCNIPIAITHGDIYRAINNLKLFEVPRIGYESLKNAEGRSMRINNYFAQLPGNLKIEVENDLDSKNGEPIRDNAYKKLILNDADKKYGQRFTPNFNVNEFTFSNELSQNHQKIANFEGNSIPHISSLPNNTQSALHETRLANDRSNEEFEEIIDLELIRVELEDLEVKDINKSNMYEHALLTYFTLYKLNDEQVRSSMYSLEDAEMLLGENGLDNLQDISEDQYFERQNSTIEDDDGNSEQENEVQAEPEVIVTKSLLNNFSYTFASYGNNLD